jgi:hypothetical protein
MNWRQLLHACRPQSVEEMEENLSQEEQFNRAMERLNRKVDEKERKNRMKKRMKECKVDNIGDRIFFDGNK